MLEYSGLLFIIPAIHAWYKNNIDYGNAFLFLSITSYIWHSCNKYKYNYLTNWRFWIDQFAILNIVLTGIYHYITYCTDYYCKLFIFICFISVIILYLLNLKIIDDRIHLVIHLLTVIAHDIIIVSY
jgi:hypothetical protein